ncbi:hypothetical protein [Lacimicrobium sp. SS2-24]|uniref:hypothetical protein n=1 Tax=Lacimicrobium sp. SS2-24 TaxID=2005569 RepID=UPI000B4B27CC|nr:hypothetical protein [Lacimicrobium sp. SS2-24]
MSSIELPQLNVWLIEKHPDSRQHLKKRLSQMGVRQVTEIRCADDFIKRLASAEANAHLVLFAFHPGDALPGTDLLRYVIRSKLLATWCQVAFITDQPDVVLADLPFRILPTPILKKNVADSALLALLRQTAVMINKVKPLLENCQEEQCALPVARVESVATETLPDPLKDVILTLQIMSLIRHNRAEQAKPLATQLVSEQRRFDLLLNLMYLLGDNQGLILLQQQLQHADLLPRKRILYQMRLLQQRQELKMMLTLFESLEESQRTPHEMNLKAVLLFVTGGYSAAERYLSKKQKDKQDTYAANMALIWRMTLLLLHSLDHPGDHQFNARMTQLSRQLDWNNGTINFKRFSGLLRLAQMAHANKQVVAESLNKLQQHQHTFDLFQCLLLTYIAKVAQHPSASLWLFNADYHLSRMQISPERLSAGIIHYQLFRFIFPTPDTQSAVYNQWGHKYVELDLHYRALSMFYKAWRCSPNVARYPLNLLHSMQSLQLNQFWDCDVSELQQIIPTLSLNEDEKLSLKKMSV